MRRHSRVALQVTVDHLRQLLAQLNADRNRKTNIITKKENAKKKKANAYTSASYSLARLDMSSVSRHAV